MTTMIPRLRLLTYRGNGKGLFCRLINPAVFWIAISSTSDIMDAISSTSDILDAISSTSDILDAISSTRDRG